MHGGSAKLSCCIHWGGGNVFQDAGLRSARRADCRSLLSREFVYKDWIGGIDWGFRGGGWIDGPANLRQRTGALYSRRVREEVVEGCARERE